jgi:hypothetical protein
MAILVGDPTHRTVLADLTTLARLEDPPVIVVHHTGWPFGRRDGFHDREIEPDAVEGGVWPGHRDAGPNGLRLVPFVAPTDLGPENGVQRAVDAHLAAHRDWRSVDIPGVHGCAILCPPGRLNGGGKLGPILRDFGTAPFLAAQVRRVERSHLTTLAELGVAKAEEALEVDQEIARPVGAKAGDDVVEAEAAPRAREELQGREELIAEAARARGELEATGRELERAHAAAAEAIERAAGAQAESNRLGELAAGQGLEIDRLGAEIAEAAERAEAVEAEAVTIRTELRGAREDAARRASEADHLAAQLTDARDVLEAFAAERLMTRRQRMVRALLRLRGRRSKEASQLEEAMRALSQASEAGLPAGDRDPSR